MTVPTENVESSNMASEPDSTNMVEPVDMMESLKEDNEYFKQMINLIPAHFYFDEDAKEKLAQSRTSHEKGDAKGNKRTGEQELSDKAKWKRAKFDPTQGHSVTEIQEQLDKYGDGEQSGKSKKKLQKIHSNYLQREENINQLKEMFQAQLAKLQEQRKAAGKNESVLTKRLMRKEKKLKMKLKKQTDKQNKVKGQANLNGIGGKKKQSTPVKPIFNKEGKMVFSKFDFSESAKKDKKSDLPTGKNYKKLLEKIEKQKEKVDKLKETDIEAAKDLKKKTAWNTALQKAEGVKIKDNPELLKKSIKKREQLKKKSKKDWEERKDKVDKKMTEKQDKRKKNIQTKKKKNVDNKIKKAKKKGRVLPGF